MMLKKLHYFICICLIAMTSLSAQEAVQNNFITELNDAQFESFIQKAEKPIIVDFWASWCGPCMKMKPIFEELASELNENFLFVSVNLEEGQQIAQKYGVTSIPTFKVFHKETVLGTFMGFTSKKNFIEHIDNAVHKKVSLSTLYTAIQTNDLELVAKCLEQKDLNVNEVSQIEMGTTTMAMTPLIMAVSNVLFCQTSIDIVSLLLKADAQVDQEIHSPEFDQSMNVIGWNKITARSLAEETANCQSAEDIAAIEDETIRERLIDVIAKAKSLLKLF